MTNIDLLRILITEISNSIYSSNCRLTPLEEETLCALKSTKEVHRILSDGNYKKVDMQAKVECLSNELFAIAKKSVHPISKMIYELSSNLDDIFLHPPKRPFNIHPADILKKQFPSAFSGGQKGEEQGERETMFD